MIFPLPTSCMSGHPGSAYKSLVIAVSSGVRWGHIPPWGKQTCFLLKKESPWGIANCPKWLFGKRQHVELRLCGIPTWGQLFVQNISIAHLNPNKIVIRGASVYFCVTERKIETERQRQKKAGRLERREFSSQVLKNTTSFQEVEMILQTFPFNSTLDVFSQTSLCVDFTDCFSC